LPEGAEQYFYGPAVTLANREGASAQPSAPSKPPKHVASASVSHEKKAIVRAAVSDDTDGGVPEPKAIAAGEYRGTDHVTIRIPGVPRSTEVDDKARSRVVTNEDGTYAVSVLDSNTGDDLCTLEGKRAANDKPEVSHIEFDAGQSCFEDVLGFDAVTALEHGSADISGENLTIRFLLKLTAEEAGVEGALDYSFEGKRQ
jgi:hypothetical protein